MDTTSNNFTWQTYTFGGDAGGSLLKDVAIINDTDIWAVGTIGLTDSSGKPDPQPYSLAHWDGTSWTLSKVFYHFIGDSSILTNMQGILYFDQRDIWFAAGSIFHFDGQSTVLSFDRTQQLAGNQTIDKLWGWKPSQLYGVGHAGGGELNTTATLGNS